jgi:sugar phosphate isomerase/epimerase
LKTSEVCILQEEAPAMQLGVLSSALQECPLDAALDAIRDLGAEVVDFACGGYARKTHCDPDALLTSPAALNAFQQALWDRNLALGALCCYANPLHPDRDMALAHRHDLRQTVLLAEALGCRRVVAFSGCPGDSRLGRFPHWVVYPWPEEMSELREWQWTEQVLPFWTAEAAFALEHGVTHVCLEPHAVNAVYNPESLLALREAVGDVIGACFNPGHLWWQGIDAQFALQALSDAVGYVHLTDCQVDPLLAPTHGLLDGKPFVEQGRRAWNLCTVGQGHGEEAWRQILRRLRQAYYDGPIVIEHEDALMSPEEGLRQSVALLMPMLPGMGLAESQSLQTVAGQ